ncbi:MAG: acyl carrier protein [Lachnospiraceae bacterium]|nr:acyl carrier protein [Lachnospiraceae bacterium]MBR4174853.1 acyl carrier protein [Lachnospiraceae bacterium]
MRDELLELLSNEFPEIDFEESDTMVDDGILDSLTITGIIAAITMEYGIEIPFEEISEDNFNSIDALADLVERLS